MSRELLSGVSAAYVDALYTDYLKNQSSVPQDWCDYFRTFSDQPSVHVRATNDSTDHVGDVWLRAFRTYGHWVAHLDPLAQSERTMPAILDIPQAPTGSCEMIWGGVSRRKSLTDWLDVLKTTYCGSIGFEYMHCALEEQAWFQAQIERDIDPMDVGSQKKLLKSLIAADGLERYLGTRYVGQKRFSLEGGDALIPCLQTMIDEAGCRGVKEIPVGMAHRGRLNVLVNVLGKDPWVLFQEFEGKAIQEGTGDVKYHMGFASDLRVSSGEIVHVVLAFNPSHLEIIAPVVQGTARSRLRRRSDLDQKNAVLPIVIHGDAAFAGQGVVMETFNFSQARGYATGGTIHIVVNNQIGFTTSHPQDARSTRYCTDVAKMIDAPILHVNGDDPEAVIRVARLALAYRMTFKRDVVIDLVCYRRHGHNEADEPAMTQPMMYQKIRTMKPLREMYAAQLVTQGVITADWAEQEGVRYRDALESGQALVPVVRGDYPGKIQSDWTPYLTTQWDMPCTTKVSRDRLAQLSQQLTDAALSIDLHTVVKKMVLDRQKMSEDQVPLNWGYAETMAYATLLHEGYSVRLSGQDCGRGTFSHRHAVLYDQHTGQSCIPLERLASDPMKPFWVIDSVLSEEAVLAFEYGYACSEPTSLVLWEAQFGDFANGAQVVIDQFISSGEQKWGRLCGLVMLLPHGYEGQGPEHSSARLERYLQLCAQQNIQVCVPTTPAQMFHLLRRQIHRPFRKPLIVMTPKSLLRHKEAVSKLADLTDGAFYPILDAVDVRDRTKVTRVVLCSGKVYYDLHQQRQALGLDHIALVRVEQLYPFPEALLKDVLSAYPQLTSVVWCQEEPQNQGAWFSSRHHIEACLQPTQTLSYAGRSFAASSAVGSAMVHAKEQQALVEQALLSD